MRCDFLRTILMGGSPEILTDRDRAWLHWATVHEPLTSPSIYTLKGRHLNNFCVGSDPEFSFRDTDGTRIEAISCGLKVGLAAGADQNERLVELRPYPSTSVVEHTAAIMSALRWMYRVYNTRARRYLWRAGAWFAGDGLGGHVHFGRKRPTRADEVAGLDGLARVFKASGLFPVEEWNRRMRGDNFHNAPYGLPGDFRVQRHGYEYRSLPSWLQSPTVAFIVLAASKLCVLDPSVTTNWPETISAMNARNLLRGLAKLYKGRDDDAYILYHLLTYRGDTVFSVVHDADFAPNWGIDRAQAFIGESEYILPSCIKPDPSEVQEMKNHLLFSIPLTFQRIAPSFKTALPSEEYQWLPARINPGRKSGFGDLLHNLVIPSRMDFYWEHTNGPELKFAGSVAFLLTSSEKEFIRRYHPQTSFSYTGATRDSAASITVPKHLCQATTISGLRAILVSTGWFPIWTVETVRVDSLNAWITSRKDVSTKERDWRIH